LTPTVIDDRYVKIIEELLLFELESPVLSKLKGLTEKEAEKWIHKFLNAVITLYLYDNKTWADCKVPRVLSFSVADLTFDRDCGILERLEEFAWTIHKAGLLKALNAQAVAIPSFAFVEHDLASPTQMVLRNKGLAAKIREGLRDVESQSTVFFAAIAGLCHVDARGACSSSAELHGTDKEVREAIEEGKDRLAVLVPARY
jgi:hypothetical protein